MTEQMHSFHIRDSVGRASLVAREPLAVERRRAGRRSCQHVTVTLLDTLDAGPIR
jgi:hypothetical protein